MINIVTYMAIHTYTEQKVVAGGEYGHCLCFYPAKTVLWVIQGWITNKYILSLFVSPFFSPFCLFVMPMVTSKANHIFIIKLIRNELFNN